MGKHCKIIEVVADSDVVIFLGVAENKFTLVCRSDLFGCSNSKRRWHNDVKSTGVAAFLQERYVLAAYSATDIEILFSARHSNRLRRLPALRSGADSTDQQNSALR